MNVAPAQRLDRAALFTLGLGLLSACGPRPAPVSDKGHGAMDGALALRPGLALSELSLYTDIARKDLADDLHEFTPAYPLWSDGAQKRRWLRLPPGARIDSADADHFVFPVGTVAFKEFSRDGVRVETRVIARTGIGAEDFFMGAFVWGDDESDARFVPEGAGNVRGTDHDVPSAQQCWGCHGGEPARILGFSAVQQARIPEALLSAPLARPFRPPGDERSRAALGYLHANCGHCHNPRGTARPDTDLALRLSVEDFSVERAGAYRTTLGRALDSFASEGYAFRVVGGRPQQSALLFRMAASSAGARMPPLGSELVDDAGVVAVRAWIEAL